MAETVNWPLAIGHNRDVLLRIVAMLCAMAGLAEGGVVSTLSRQLRNRVLRILRPAESAVRRLIVIAARGAEVPAPALSPGGASKGRSHGGGPGDKRKDGSTPPSLPLLDALPVFRPGPRYRRPKGFPRISIIGVTEPRPIPEYWIPSPDDPVSAAGLCRRLQALRRALDDLDGCAKRFARWRVRRDWRFRQKDRLPGRYSPFRPGHPPGHRRRARYEVDEVLRECHSLAVCALRLDTS